MAQVHCEAESSRTAASRALGHFDTQQLEEEIARRMAQFSSRQLERELARRRKKRARTRRTGISSSEETGPGNNADTPIDLTEHDLEWNVVMKIDNEDEVDLQSVVKSEGEYDSEVNPAEGNDEYNDCEPKVESESDDEDDLYVAGSPDGRNGFKVKIENEGNAESHAESNVVNVGRNDFRATVEDESEGNAESHLEPNVVNVGRNDFRATVEDVSEIDGENDSGDYFWAPTNNDEGSGMDDNTPGVIQDDIEIGVEANVEDENGFEGGFDYSIENYMDQDVEDGMDDNKEDEIMNGMGDGVETDMENEVAQDRGDGAENVLENGVEDSDDDDMGEDVETDMEGALKAGKQPPSVKETRGRGRRPTRRKKASTSAVYKASVHSLAELGTIRVNSSTADIDHSMMEKIKNCLLRGQHLSTPEPEAKRALLHAKLLMKRYNVSRAEVLAHEPLSTQIKYAGQSSVVLRRVDGDRSKSLRQHCFVDHLLKAMRTFFDCKMYSADFTRSRPNGTTYCYSVEFIFYGIAENTIAAAMGFEMAYNLISEWARPLKGKNCYCLGAAKQLRRMAEAEKSEEETQAKKAESDAISARMAQEAAEEKARLARLNPVPDSQDQPSSPNLLNGENGVITLDREDDFSSGDSPDSKLLWVEKADFNDSGDEEAEADEDDSDDNRMEADFTIEDQDMEDVGGESYEEASMMNQAEFLISNPLGEMYGVSRPTSPGISHPDPAKDNAADTEQRSSGMADPETGLDQNWASQMQLTIFRANAIKIADEYLKDQGVTLGKPGRRRKNYDIKDVEAYQRGERDGEKIDVHQRRIKEAELADDIAA